MATGQSSYSSTSGTTYYDLTTENGDRAEINNALFFQDKPDDSSGTGLIQAIVRVQDPGGGDGEENGYNTSFRPLSYEENTSPQFTTSLLLNSVPIVTIDGVQYYEFRLDINQENNSSLLSLDAIKIYSSDASKGQAQGLITGSWFTDNATLRYDLDGGGNSSILLDASLSSGSGSSDMFFYVPVSNFAAVDPDVTYVTLYSEFGDAGVLDAGDGLSPLDDPVNTALEDDGVDTGDTAGAVFGTYTANDGFEEWSVSKQTGGVISGFKFADVNGNGLWDDGETGLAGWTIDYEISYVAGKGNNQQTVTLTGSAVTSDGTTDVDGDGDIDPAGFYTIFVPASTDKNEIYTVTLTEDAQADFVNTYDGDVLANYTTTFTFSGDDLTLGGSPNISGQFETTETMNFGNFELFDISGTKYTDLTGDGLSGDDTGRGGVTIFIDVDGNNIDDDGYSTITAGDGTYSFTDLDHTVIGAEVKEVTPTGYVQTVGQVGTVTGTEYLITGVDQEDLDFANFELFDISGTKFTDITGDGLSGDDTGLGGVTIFIDVDGNNIDDDGYSTITAGDGTYSFTDLDYTVAGAEVKEITPTGYVQTVGQIGAVTDTNYVITGTSGEDQDDFDFANFLPDPSIDIEKYVKTDVSGVFVDADDPDGPLASTSTTVDFKVVVSNDGNEALSGITLTDTIDHNGAETNEVIDYNLINAEIDIDNDSVIDGFWSDYDEDQDGTLDDADGDFTTVDDFILAPGASFAVYYSLDSALGQHENTASVEAVSAISDTTVSDEDDANYYVVESEDCVGVRTPGFWQNSKWGLFWNLDANNPGQTATDQDALPQAGQPNFPGGELLYAIDTNEDGYVNAIAGDGINDAEPLDTNASGLLIGDYNKNGITDLGLDGIANTGDAGEEDTLFISLADAKALINSSNKNLEGKAADGIFMLGRDVVATWLNYLANNPEGTTGECIGDVSGATNTPREYLDAAIDWLQQFASTTNGNPNLSWHDGNEQEKFSFDPKINPSSAVWQNPFTVGEDIPVSAAAMHSALDGYNNTGMINGVEYCCDADSPLVLNVLSQII